MHDKIEFFLDTCHSIFKLIWRVFAAIITIYFAIFSLVAPVYVLWQLAQDNISGAIIMFVLFFWLWGPLYYAWKKIILFLLKPFIRAKEDPDDIYKKEYYEWIAKDKQANPKKLLQPDQKILTKMDTSAIMELSKLSDLKEANKRKIHSLPPPKKCDLCCKGLLEEQYYIDGALRDSEGWANMCPKCFFEKGRSIGWGVGQIYKQDKEGSWLLVAGFPPKDHDKDEVEEGPVCDYCGEEYQKDDMVEIDDGKWACQNCIEEAESIMGQWQNHRKDEDS